MNLYLDSSALVKRYVKESGSSSVDSVMAGASAWSASQLTFVEVLRVVSADRDAASIARREWGDFDVIALNQAVCERAVGLASHHGLKSLDAIQLASALTAPDVIFATFDRKLHTAAQAEGLTTLPA